MKTLHLNLKRQWFDMIKSGEKKEEYRALSGYWINRFIKNDINLSGAKIILAVEDLKKGYSELEVLDIHGVYFSSYDAIIFSNGYAKDRDQFEIALKGISIKEGRSEWGAEKGKKYFALDLGKSVDY